MDSLNLVISVTSKRNIVSKYIPDPVLLPEFALGDVIKGRISVVAETNDPTEPTLGVAVTTSSKIALTDGLSVTYATAGSVTIENSNDITFNLDVDSVALVAVLTGDYIEAFLEVRATMGGVDSLIAKEPVVITKSVTAPP